MNDSKCEAAFRLAFNINDLKDGDVIVVRGDYYEMKDLQRLSQMVRAESKAKVTFLHMDEDADIGLLTGEEREKLIQALSAFQG